MSENGPPDGVRSPAHTASHPGLYEGLTCVEFADRRNQFVGKILSDGGARVIQVEPPGGSPGRYCGPFVNDEPNPNTCLDYWFYNTGKESVVLDLDAADGVHAARRLVERSDVVVESARPGRMAEVGLDYASLSGVNPDVIYASLTDFGQDGPWRDYLNNDIGSLALGGPMAASGYTDPATPPIAGLGHQASNLAGTLCVQAIVVALIERLTSGHGQYIDCAIHDCCAVCTENGFTQWAYNSKALYRHTGQHATVNRQAPTQLVAADGRYINAVATRYTTHIWTNLLLWMNEEGVAGDLNQPEYQDEAYRNQRSQEGAEIQEAIGRLIARVPADVAMARAQSFGLTWAVVRAPEENYDEAHWQERGFFMPVAHPELTPLLRYPGRLFLCEQAPLYPARRAPRLGEHTETVLRKLSQATGGAVR